MPVPRSSSHGLRAMRQAAAITASTGLGAVTCVLWAFVSGMLRDLATTPAGPDGPTGELVEGLAFFSAWLGTAMCVWCLVPAWVCLWKRGLLPAALFVWGLGLGTVTGMMTVDASTLLLQPSVTIAISGAVVLLGLAFVGLDPFRVWRLPETPAPGVGAAGVRGVTGPGAPAARAQGPRAIAP